MRVVLLVALVVVPAALAAHPSRLIEVKANLDADRAPERIVGVEDVSSDHSVWRASVRVVDRCAGRSRTHQLVGGFQRLGEAKAEQADARGAKEVLGVLYNVSANDGIARLVRLAGRSQRCPTLRTLFQYRGRQSPRPAPEAELVQFTVDLVELDSSRPGRELRVTELFQIPPMLSSIHRESLYRYVRARDGYVLYETNTHRVP
jgi:hypothetical protein